MAYIDKDARRIMIIDTHSHWIPPAYAQALEEEGKVDPGVEATRQIVLGAQGADLLKNLDARFLEMDEAGVEVAALEIPPPGVGFADAGRAAAAATAVNDELIAACDQHPDRLRAMITLPLPHADEAVAEIERVSDHALVRGVELFGVTGRFQTDSPDLEPVLRAIADAGLVAQMHPAFEPPADAMRSWGLGGSLGAVFGNSLAAARMILSGVLDRVPHLDLIVTHLGGTLPYLEVRVDDLSGTGDAKNPIGFYLRERVWTDNCSYHRPALMCAAETMGASRILTGSDYPFRGTVKRCIDDIRESPLSDDDKALILHRNALRWFE
jgi:aminocarboxymuconate-semialdehyde decarboxylase